MTHRLTLEGSVPSKKNCLQPRRGAGRGLRYRDGVRDALDALQVQAQAFWRLSPLKRPRVKICLYGPVSSQDPDNQATTILDVLKKAGVLADDSKKSLSPPLVIDWLIVDGDPWTEVHLEDLGGLDGVQESAEGLRVLRSAKADRRA